MKSLLSRGSAAIPANLARRLSLFPLLGTLSSLILFAVIGCGHSSSHGLYYPSGEGGLADLRGRVVIDGSSTVFPLVEAVADHFRKEFPRVNVTIAVSGTGGGFKRFTQGETDISNASRPIKWEEFEQCQLNDISFVELPLAFDGLTIAVNPENDWVQQLTVEQLQQIFLRGGARTWRELNSAWPDLPIRVFSPGKDSGTYDYFMEVMVGDTSGSMRDDMSESENDNFLVTGVAGDKGAIGFFGAAYYFENQSKVRAVPIVNPETGMAVEPNAETIQDGSYAPFGRPVFFYVNVASLRRPEMKKFVQFQLKNAGELAASVGYVALPDDVYRLAEEHVAQRWTGTHYYQEPGHKRTGQLTEVFTRENLLDAE
jgi:phosphate transport system substrate-binding protein